MDTAELLRYIDHQRWLMNNGLFTDAAKNQLFTYGSLAHKDVRAVELNIDIEKHCVHYAIYVDKSLLKKIELYHELSKATSFFGLRRFRKLLKQEGDLNFKNILSGFVKDFCGPKWSVNVTVHDHAQYVEGYDSELAGREAQTSTADNRSAN